MRSKPRQEEMRPCAFCGVMFPPVVPWQEFCNGRHRSAYNQLRGTMGRIVTVRRLAKGKTSITMHFSGPSAESALKLAHGEDAYVARTAAQK